MIRIAIVEDEDSATFRLHECLDRFAKESGVAIEQTCFKSAVSFLKEYTKNYDIIFMDIDMPDLNGMEASRKLRKLDQSVVIIFVTNLAQYAIKGYEVGALDFILKPVNYYSFKLKMRRAVNTLTRKNDPVLTLSKGTELSFIKASDLYYVEVMGHNLTYHTSMGVFNVKGSLRAAEAALTSKIFFRSNYCYIVNLNHVRKLDKNTITMTGGDELLVSRNRKKEFLRRMAEIYVNDDGSK